MVANVTTFTLVGVTPRQVTVEVDLRQGLPSFTIVGLGDRSVREARERVRAAIHNAGWSFPPQRVTVNLAPADLQKVGPGFDLAIACGVLATTGVIPAEALTRTAIFGELALDGGLRPCRGVLAVAEGARAIGIDAIIVPAALTEEAALVDDIAVFGACDLAEVAAILCGTGQGTSVPVVVDAGQTDTVDLADVRGHAIAVRALTIAAAGGHHILLSGPTGTGKTMLARRLPTLLPALSSEDLVAVMRIQSIAGTLAPGERPTRPFRAPHHSISCSGLVGGGVVPVPGEVTLAHRGVLFLDELAEFSRNTLEALRQPLEDRHVTIVRGQRSVRFPADVQLVAASNPCPCGYAGTRRCRCGELQIDRYQRRLSGPLLDRIDMIVDVHAPTDEELGHPPVTDSATVLELVVAAQTRQTERNRLSVINAGLSSAELAKLPRSEHADTVLRRAYSTGMLSPRGRDRVLRVARTIADLAGHEQVTKTDLLEAVSLRSRGTKSMDLAA